MEKKSARKEIPAFNFWLNAPTIKPKTKQYQVAENIAIILIVKKGRIKYEREI